MNFFKTRQHVFVDSPLAVFKMHVTLSVWQLMCTNYMYNNIPYYGRYYVLHKGNLHLHTHINNIYETKKNTQIAITKHTEFTFIINIFPCFFSLNIFMLLIL